jgi:hypothetical protein
MKTLALKVGVVACALLAADGAVTALSSCTVQPIGWEGAGRLQELPMPLNDGGGAMEDGGHDAGFDSGIPGDSGMMDTGSTSNTSGTTAVTSGTSGTTAVTSGTSVTDTTTTESSSKSSSHPHDAGKKD